MNGNPLNSEPRFPGPSKRLFVALTPPAPVRAVLAALAEPMPGVSWTAPERLHVTLRFLGDVPEAGIAALREKLRAIRVAAFLLPVEGVGAFPAAGPPRVLWVGVGAGHPRLFQLRQRLDDALLAAGLNVELRTFHPHLTLARCREEARPALRRWLHAHGDFAGPSFRVEAFDLYASELRPEGAVHVLTERFPLGP